MGENITIVRLEIEEDRRKRRDEEERNLQLLQDMLQWSCKTCTLKNEADNNNCSICGAPKAASTWNCSRGHRNVDGVSLSCFTCGLPKPLAGEFANIMAGM